ncbi:hypothetical protein EIG95_04855, partial [Staphylococcus aureus]
EPNVVLSTPAPIKTMSLLLDLAIGFTSPKIVNVYHQYESYIKLTYFFKISTPLITSCFN